MKLQMGYFDKDGHYIGRKLDTNRRKKYFVAIGTLRKKIAEHEDQSPYKNHKFVLPYSKNYCDKNRILVQFDEYDNGRKKREISHIAYRYNNTDYEHIYNITRRMKDYIITNFRRLVHDADNIEMIFFPGSGYTELQERRRR